MSYYIRKISRAKWPEDVSEVEVKDVRADAITGCLRTASDELSLWKVDKIGNPEEDVLPIITGFEKPNRCEIVYIDEQLFREQGIEVIQENFVKLSDRKVKSIIKELVESGRLSAEQLNDTMQEKLGYVKGGNF